MPSSNSVRLSLCSRLGLCHTHLRAHATRLVGLQVYGLQEEKWDQSALSIVVVGASGDLAKKKIFPALFALYYEKMLPKVCSSAWRTCHSPPAWLLDAMPCPSTALLPLRPWHRTSRSTGMRAARWATRSFGTSLPAA